MADALENGLPFEVGDLWRVSALVEESDKQDSLFDFPVKQASGVGVLGTDEAAHFAFDTEELGLPRLEDLQLVEPDPSREYFDLAKASEPHEDDRTDEEAFSIWTTDLTFEKHPKLCTWESFNKSSRIGSEHYALLSEAGPLTTHVALRGSQNTGEKNGVLPQDPALKALCSLCLGRSSMLFQWNEAAGRFKPVLSHVSILGLSQRCSEKYMADFLEYGTLVVQLQRIVDDEAGRSACPSILALRNGVASIISAATGVLTAAFPFVRTLLQLQNVIIAPRRLLSNIWFVTERTKSLKTDTSVIATLADYVSDVTLTDDSFCEVWRALLARVARPWLEALAADLRLSNTMFVPQSGLDQDAAKEPLELVSPSKMRRKGREATFLTSEDRELIDKTKSALCVLSQHVPGHPVITPHTWGIQPPTEFLDETNLTTTQVAERAYQYEASIIEAMSKIETGRTKSLIGKPASPRPSERDDLDQPSWVTDAQEDYLEMLGTKMSKPPDDALAPVSDELYKSALAELQHYSDADVLNLTSIVPRSSFSIINQALPLIKMQYRLANGVLMRYLFRNCRLRQHLELQHSYHLLQSGDFVDRLATALFSSDVQSGERTGSALQTGQKMGLRLGATAKQRWPPASSELQLTLMGILNETYAWQDNDKFPLGSKEYLPGDLSFAIRELPEDEIELALNPGSIHALDFLRLQYTPPAPLDTVLTSELLSKYDDTFRFLLVLLRSIYLVTEMRAQLALARVHSSSDGIHAGLFSNSVSMFALEAHHFVSALASFAMDVGIEASWGDFAQKLAKVEQDLEAEDKAGEVMTRTSVGVEGLKQLHGECLERIRTALFLRKRQERLQKTIKAVLAAVLDCAGKLPTAKGDQKDFDIAYESLRKSTSTFHDLLQERIDRASNTSHTTEDSASEAELCRMLLLRLKWRDS